MGNYTHVHPGIAHPFAGERHYAAGALAGFIGGIVMAIVAMIVTASMGAGMLMPLKAMAALLLGVDALVGGAGAIIVGMMIHFATAIILGLIFAAIIGDARPGAAFGLGLIYGFGVWIVMTFLILPAANPTMSARVAMMGGWWFVEHLVYGGMLFLLPILHRTPSARRL